MPIDPSQTYVLLAADGSAEQVPGGEAFWSRPGHELDELGRQWLVSEFECSADWPNWEMHPNGDEFVYLLAGEVDFQLQTETGMASVHLQGRGAVVVPRGVWHTAKVSVPSRMLFVTLGAGTWHRPVQPNDAQRMAGYSGTPLTKKLGIAPGAKVCAIGAPPEYRELLEPLPDAVQFVSAPARTTDLVHVFVARRAELASRLARLRAALRPDATVWVSWPKKAAKVASDVSEDTVRELALPLGFVDVKVCAVSDVWSGLKLVVRKELR